MITFIYEVTEYKWIKNEENKERFYNTSVWGT